MKKIRKTVSIDLSVYNECLRKMRLMRINDFSKFVNYVLRTQADEKTLASKKSKEFYQQFLYYQDLIKLIEDKEEEEQQEKIFVSVEA